MQKSFETQRLERDETLGRGLGAGLGGLLAAYSPSVVTETLGSVSFFKEIAAWLVHTPPVGWTTFLAAAIPNAMATIAYNTADDYLEDLYGKKALLNHQEFHAVVLYGTSILFFVASAVLIAKITEIAVVVILGCSCMGWIANQVIKIACALFLSFDERQKETSKQLDMYLLTQTDVKSLTLPKEKKPDPSESPPTFEQPPIDVELWQMAESLPGALANYTAYALDLACQTTFSTIQAKKDAPFEWTEEVDPSCSIKGIPNIGNSCYQNSAVQILIDLIEFLEEAGEEGFEIYKIKKTPPPTIDIKDKKNQPTPPIDGKEIEESKEPIAVPFFSSFLPSIFGGKQQSPEDASLIEHFERLAMEKLAIKEKTKENAQEIVDCALKYRDVFRAFEQMRKEYKEQGITSSTATAFRKGLYELFFSNKAITPDTSLTAQRDPVEVLRFMLDILGSKKMPICEYYAHSIRQNELEEVKKLLKERTLVTSTENIGEEQNLPVYEKQRYQFEENVKNRPFDLKKMPDYILETSISTESSKDVLTIENLIFKPPCTTRESFTTADKVLKDGKEAEACFPHVFPECEDLKNWEAFSNIDPKDDKKTTQIAVKKKPIQVIKTTQENRLYSDAPLPPFLIINLKRAMSATEKNCQRVRPEPTMYIEIYNEKHQVCQWRKCTLRSATVQPFGSASGGHWTAYRKDKKGQWYLCDDRSIRKIKDEKAMFETMTKNGTIFVYIIEKEVFKENPLKLKEKRIGSHFGSSFSSNLLSKFRQGNGDYKFSKANGDYISDHDFDNNFDYRSLDHVDDYSDDVKLDPENPCPCTPYKKPESFTQLAKSPTVTPSTTVYGIKNIENSSCYQNSAVRLLINLFSRVGESGFEIYEMINTPKDYAEKRIRSLQALNEKSDQQQNKKSDQQQKELKDLQEIIENNTFDSGIDEKNLVLMVHINKLIESNTELKEKKQAPPIYLKVIRSFQQMLKDRKTGIKEETAKELRTAVHQLCFQHQKTKNGITDQQDPDELLTFLLEVLGGQALPLQDFLSYSLNHENLKKVEELRQSTKLTRSTSLIEEEDSSLPDYEETKYNFAVNVENQPCELGEYNNNPIITRSINPVFFNKENTIPTLEMLLIDLGKNERETFSKSKRVLDLDDKDPNMKKCVERSYPHAFPDNKDQKKNKYPEIKMPIQVIDTHTKAYIKSTDVPKVKYGIFEFKRYTGCANHETVKHHLQMMPNEVMHIPIFDEKENKEIGTLKMTLTAACVHPSGNINGGHWISYALEEDGWYLYNDDKVGKVEENDKQQMLDQMSVNGTLFTYVIEEIKN